MNNFGFHNPVDIHFGKGAAEDLPAILAGKAKKVMLVFGGKSAKANGSYDDFHRILEGAGFEVVDFGGVDRPDNKYLMAGIDLAKKEGVDCVIGIGGSCCMDFSKMIAFGAKNDNIWAWLTGERPYEGTEENLMIGCVPTFPGGGSEVDVNGEVDNFEENTHGTLVGPFPNFAIMDPTYTYTLNLKQSATAAMMGFCQLATGSMAAPNIVSDSLAYGSMQAIVKGLEAIAKDPEDYEARCDLMWAPAMSTFGLATAGKKDTWGYNIYEVMAGIRLANEQPYRVAFPTLLPHFIKAEAKYHTEDVKNFFVNVFEVDASLDDEALLEAGFKAMKDMYTANGLPWHFDEIGKKLPMEQIEALAEEVKDGIDVTYDELVHFFASACSADYE